MQFLGKKAVLSNGELPLSDGRGSDQQRTN